MNETILGNQLRKVPSIAVGCMRLSEKSKEEMNHFIHSALEQGADLPLTSRVLLAYNKFSSKTGRILQGVELKNIGGAQRFENATPQQLLQQLAAMGIFDKILA